MDEIDSLTERIRDRLADTAELTEDRVFDGVGFFIDGRMAVAVVGDAICVHLDDGSTGRDENEAEAFQFAGRPVPGWVSIPAGQLDDEALSHWVGRGLANVTSAM